MNIDFKHGNITEKIIRSAYKVHGFLGCGFQELFYTRALALELTEEKLT